MENINQKKYIIGRFSYHDTQPFLKAKYVLESTISSFTLGTKLLLILQFIFKPTQLKVKKCDLERYMKIVRKTYYVV